MKKTRATLTAVAVLSALSLTAGTASAVPITGIGDDQVDYSFSSLQNGVTLSGTVNVDVTVYDKAAKQVKLFVTLANTTPTATTGTNRWTHWGFGSSPNVASIVFTDVNDGGMTGADISNFPALGLLEACSTSGPNCAGGGGGGIGENSSDSFTLILNYSASIDDGIDLSPFGVKFQAVGANDGSVEFYTCVSNCGTPPPPQECSPTEPGCQAQQVPEPASLTLLGIGLAGLAFARRRRRK